MQINEYNCPDELYYHREHCWARVEDGIVVVGVQDFAQEMAGPIKRVVTLEEEDEVNQDKPFGTMSSGKWTGKLYSPVSGEIEEVNEELEDNAQLINDDPYGDGWIIKISPSNLDSDLSQLWRTGAEFETWLKKEIENKKALIEK